jgi:3-oxoacyl-[acyl-carrier protein] reductase
MNGTLNGKVAIVTGGASGIGGASARQLANDGAQVLVVDINEEKANDNAERIRTNGGEAQVLLGDVSQEEIARTMVESAVEQFGRLDILVQNAFGGVRGSHGSALEITHEGYRAGMAQLVDALYLGPRYAVPAMEASGPPPNFVPPAWSGAGFSSAEMPPTEVGRIVNISSVHGILQAARWLVYETGKAAVIGLTKQMAIDFGPLGITVNAIAPGHIMTEALQNLWREEGNEKGYHLFELQYPVRRTGTPEDIAHAVSFLSSPQAAFINGVLLPVDGGMSIQLQENIVMEVVDYIRENPDLRTHFDNPKFGKGRS